MIIFTIIGWATVIAVVFAFVCFPFVRAFAMFLLMVFINKLRGQPWDS